MLISLQLLQFTVPNSIPFFRRNIIYLKHTIIPFFKGLLPELQCCFGEAHHKTGLPCAWLARGRPAVIQGVIVASKMRDSGFWELHGLYFTVCWDFFFLSSIMLCVGAPAKCSKLIEVI